MGFGSAYESCAKEVGSSNLSPCDLANCMFRYPGVQLCHMLPGFPTDGVVHMYPPLAAGGARAWTIQVDATSSLARYTGSVAMGHGHSPPSATGKQSHFTCVISSASRGRQTMNLINLRFPWLPRCSSRSLLKASLAGHGGMAQQLVISLSRATRLLCIIRSSVVIREDCISCRSNSPSNGNAPKASVVIVSTCITGHYTYLEMRAYGDACHCTALHSSTSTRVLPCTTRSSRFRIPSTPRQAPSYHIKEKPPRAEICR